MDRRCCAGGLAYSSSVLAMAPSSARAAIPAPSRLANCAAPSACSSTNRSARPFGSAQLLCLRDVTPVATSCSSWPPAVGPAAGARGAGSRCKAIFNVPGQQPDSSSKGGDGFDCSILKGVLDELCPPPIGSSGYGTGPVAALGGTPSSSGATPSQSSVPSSSAAFGGAPKPPGNSGGVADDPNKDDPTKAVSTSGTSSTSAATASTQTAPTTSATSTNLIRGFHVVSFFVVLAIGLVFLTVLLYSTGDMQFRLAATKVVKRLLKTVALRQVVAILAAMMFVRFGLEPLVRTLRGVFRAQGVWEKSTEFFVLREVYRPLEVLFLIAAAVTLAENFLPQLIAIPKSLVQNVVRSTLSLTFVIASARVVYNIKGRMFRELAWQLEVKGDVTRQRRIEAIDKLMSVLTLIVASVFSLQALGLDINSVLAIGGIGGLAVGLAGREILENLFTGLIILSSSPFEVGEEVLFKPNSGQVIEGIVLDVGWYRTIIRSFEREIFCIPNAAFSRNVVLNVTRKGKEWRFYEFIGLRVEDIKTVSAVVADMRKIIRQDPRIIQKLHRRVFLDKLTREQVSIYISFYVEAANRDAFMAIKQDLLLAFVDCVERNNAKLARNRWQIEFLPAPIQPALAGPGVARADGSPAEVDASRSLPAPVDVTATPSVSGDDNNNGNGNGGGGGSGNGGGSSGAAEAAAAALGGSAATAAAAAGGGKRSGSPSAGAAAPKRSDSPAAAAPSSSSSSPSGPAATTTTAAGAAAAAAATAAATAAGGSASGPMDSTDSVVDGGAAALEKIAAAAGIQPAVVSRVASAAAAALMPDDILTSHQDGVMVTGSWEEI